MLINPVVSEEDQAAVIELRTGNLLAPWPEEANRKLAGVLAAHHFAPTEKARQNLLREGVKPEQITVTGNTVIDALLWVKAKIEQDAVLRHELAAAILFLIRPSVCSW